MNERSEITGKTDSQHENFIIKKESNIEIQVPVPKMQNFLFITRSDAFNVQS